MNKILCPVDFSEASLNAIEFAMEIGKKFHSRLTLVYIFTEEDFNKVVDKQAAGSSFKELLAMARNKLKRLAKTVNTEVLEQGLAGCDFVVEMGKLAERIRDIAEETHYDLVVMGTTGISKTSGIFIGSNTEEVIEEVKKPILCIPETARFSKFKKLVYASGFLMEDRVAIQEVIFFATIFDARIDVVHVSNTFSEDRYTNFVNELKSFITYSKVSFSNVHYEDVNFGLNDYLEKEKGDMLVVFNRNRGIISNILGKSMTKKLVFSIEKPLLVLNLNNLEDA